MHKLLSVGIYHICTEENPLYARASYKQISEVLRWHPLKIIKRCQHFAKALPSF
jgi:hypothetical protein